MMPLRFYFERGSQQTFDLRVAASAAQGRLDVDLRVRKQAGPYLAVRREPQAPAGGAEVPGDGADEPDRPLRARHLVIDRGPGREGRGEGDEGTQFPLDGGAHLVGRDADVAPPAVVCPDGHEFD